jgi:UDP-2-acetamido-3-amino-2,3-dideoxy-glucuronate N-acetyltransferase
MLPDPDSSHPFPEMSIAVVGAGYWGKNHVRVFNELGVLTHVCDAECDTVCNFTNQYPGVTCTSDYQDILDTPSIHGIVVATPAVTHYEVALKALEAGKDVLVEKPLALTEKDGRELVDIADKNGRILMVGHILLYHPAVTKLKEIIDSGELGRIRYIQSNRLSLGKIRTDENILWSFAPHDISVILYLLNEFPSRVSSVGYSSLQPDIEDVTISNLEFPSGVGAHIYVSWMNPFKEQRLVVVGNRKMAVFQDSAPDKKLQIYNHSFEWIRRQPVPVKGEVEEVFFEYKEPLKEECLHFLECIKTRRRPRSDGEEGLRTLRVLQKSYDSMKGSPSRSQQVPSIPILHETREYFAHETAVIDEPCRIGKGTRIWHFSHVLPEAEIGEKCNIGANVLVGKGVKIGNGCKIQNNVSVYEGVTLEDYVFCGPSMVFTNVYNPRCEIPRMSELRTTLVRKGATIGANATVVCGHTIGAYAFIGAGTVVTRDVVPHALMVGNPARRIGWMCHCGNRLQGNDIPGTILKCVSCNTDYERTDIGVVKLEDSQKVTSVPLLDLKAQYVTIKHEVMPVIEKVLESQYFILGPEVEALEKEVAEYCSCKFSVGVTSGTDALLVSLMALGIGPGDEVITTPFTFFATVGSILRLGAIPVFADIDPDTFNIDPEQIALKISSKTKAIIPVHLFGQSADMDPILELASKHGLAVIEDAAQAIGTEYKGRRAGSMGSVGCFSFFPSKNLGGFGDGGMVTTNDQSLADKMRIIRNQGSKPKYFHKLLGGNFRLDALQAAILRVKLSHLDDWTEKRRANAAYYTQRFQELGLVPDVVVPPPLVRERHIYNQYVIRCKVRDNLQAFLKSRGVSTEIYYPKPMHTQECLGALIQPEGSYPVSEKAANEVLALPIYPELTIDQKEYVLDGFFKFRADVYAG